LYPWRYVPGWSALPESRAWNSEHNVAFIRFAERLLALVKLVQDLPFSDAPRKNLSLLIKIKTEVYGPQPLQGPANSMPSTYQFQSARLEPTSSTHPDMIDTWFREAKRNPEKWETSALATVHRLIDAEIIRLLSIPEAMTWDISDELAPLITARNQVNACSVVNGKEAKCAGHALFQPLIDRSEAMLIENRVTGAVEGRLPAEIVEVILGWALIREGNSQTVRDSKAPGGFRVTAGTCIR
jgi:hypothetical protein